MSMLVPGLRVLATTFDAFLVDVWGVIHDGDRPFEGVLEALEALARARRPVVLVTNTSRTGELVVRTLGAMGLDHALFHDVVTAGDVTRAALVARDPAVFAGLPAAPRCYHLGDESYVPWLFELGLDFTDDVAVADLVLATGAFDNAAALAAARELLAPAAARNAPLVCTNPDRIIPSAKGMRLGPGAIARAYGELGAPTFLYGKPHAPIYAEARRRLSFLDPSARLIAIGDTLETDVRGAADARIPSALVVGSGVHAAELGSADESVLRTFFEREGMAPELVLPRFAW